MELIKYPQKKAEAEIQALLWYFLRKRKIDARLQVVALNPTRNKRTWKLDLVVFVDRTAKCIVECKSWQDNYARTAIYRTNNTGQIKKYRAVFGLPVLICARMSFIDGTIAEIEKIISNQT